MINNIKLLVMLSAVLLVTDVFAAEPAVTNHQAQQNDNVTPVQKIIDEFKTYASSLTPEVRDEIIAYRKEIVKINKQKRELYQKLSVQAQGYLSKEQEYKKKLSLQQKRLINIDNVQEESIAPTGGNNKDKK